jgi:hypothetical protein
MKLRAGYDRRFHYIGRNARRLAYDVGFHVYQLADGTFILGYEVVQETTNCRFGSGASRLDFEGTLEEAESHARVLLEKMIDDLPGRDSIMRTSERAGYRIVEWSDGTDGDLKNLVLSCPELVLGRHVAIASCDSGPYRPTNDELAAGWWSTGGLAVSPIVEAVSRLPMPGFDEWYVYDTRVRFEPHANFVNRLGFSAFNIDDEYTDAFWRQVVTLAPLHVLGSGTSGLFLATRDHALFDAALRAVKP